MLFFALMAAGFADAAEEAGDPQKTPLSERLRFSGSLEAEWALGLKDGGSQKLEAQFQARMTVDLPRDMRWTTIVRVRTDLCDRLEPGNPGEPEITASSRRLLLGDRVDAELRECFMEGMWEDTYWVVGKQQTVWGKADGLKVLDVVNPQDYREFVLDEWEDSRIPLWTLKAEVPVADMTLQLLWIPDPSCHRLPQEDALFAVRAGQPAVPDFFHIEMHNADRPARFFADSDVGLRLSAFKKGWDLSLNYLYHYDDMPVLHRRIGLSAEGPTVHVYPEYVRSHLIGATFSNAFGKLTFRGEVALNPGKYYAMNWLSDEAPARKTNQFSYVLGFDWYGIEETVLSLQFFQDWVVSSADDLIRDKVESYVSFLGRRDFCHDTVLLEGLLLEELSGGGGMVRFELSHEVRDGVRVWAGLDVFHGARRNVLGQFDDRDRFTVGVKWFF